MIAMRATMLLGMLVLNGCVLFRSDPSGCEAVADRDPAVRDYLAKSAGTPEFIRNHADDFKLARLSALQKCQRERGVIPAGGGVEPYRPVK